MTPFKKSNLNRKRANRAPRKTFLIVTEGQKTEPLYFSSFGLSSVTIKGTGFNSLSLVKCAVLYKKDHPEFDEVWCVFDRDSFAPAQITTVHDLVSVLKDKILKLR